MYVVVLYVLPLLLSVEAITDLTITEWARGEDVVEAVVQTIQEKCVFEDDAQILRRWARASSDDGQAPETFRSAFYGGIWQITEKQYSDTKNAKTEFLTSVKKEFGIDWVATKWKDLLKPLYSGLAARLTIAMLAKKFPKDLETQAKVWSRITGLTKEKYAKAANSISSICDASVDIALLIDFSANISAENFSIMKTFMKTLVGKFNVKLNRTRVAVFFNRQEDYIEFTYTVYPSNEQLEAQIDKIIQKPGNIFSKNDFEWIRRYMFTWVVGSRNAVKINDHTKKDKESLYYVDPDIPIPNILVTITDWNSPLFRDTIRSEQNLSELNITSFLVSVKDDEKSEEKEDKKDEWESFASEKDINYFTISTKNKEFDYVSDRIAKIVCAVKTEILHGPKNRIPEGGKAYYTYESTTNCQTLEMIAAMGEAKVYFASEYQPNPAKFDHVSNFSVHENGTVLSKRRGKIFLTVVTETLIELRFYSAQGQCSCPEGKSLPYYIGNFEICTFGTRPTGSSGTLVAILLSLALLIIIIVIIIICMRHRIKIAARLNVCFSSKSSN